MVDHSKMFCHKKF